MYGGSRLYNMRPIYQDVWGIEIVQYAPYISIFAMIISTIAFFTLKPDERRNGSWIGFLHLRRYYKNFKRGEIL